METDPRETGPGLQGRAWSLVRKHQDHILAVIRQKEMEQYRGEGVFCPVCRHPFSSFAPVYAWKVGQARMQDDAMQCVKASDSGRCPGCGSLPRQRLLWKYLLEQTNALDGRLKKVLEIAPDLPFFNLFSSIPRLEYFPCDLNPGKQKYEGYPWEILKADVCNLPFEADSFDIVLCCHVLEHVSDDGLALRELFRVMKPGGWGILQSPVDERWETTFEDAAIDTPEGREKAFGQWDHLRKYGRDYTERLAGSGFQVSVVDYVRTFTEPEVDTFGFDRYEKIFLCSK